MAVPIYCIRFMKFVAFYSVFLFPLCFIILIIRRYLEKQLEKGKVLREKYSKEAKQQNDTTRIQEIKLALEEIAKRQNETRARKLSQKTKFEKFADEIERNRFGHFQFLLGITAVYWMSNLIPIGAVAFMPLTIAPLMKLVTAKEIIRSYMTNANMMILSGSILSLGAADAGLSKRVALLILSLSGSNQRRMALCVMLFSLIFSMWWINTAVMIFMSKVIDDIIHELKEGVAFGTLGDIRMDEWNSVTDALNKAKARKKATKDAIMQHAYDRPSIEEALMPMLSKNTQGYTSHQDSEMHIVRSELALKTDKFHNLTLRESIRLITSGLGFSFGTEASKRHEEIRLEIRRILEEIRRSLYHCAAVLCSVGGIYWTYSPTTNPQLFHSKAVRGVTLIDWATWTFPILVITVPFIIFCLDFAHFGPDFLSPVLQILRLQNINYDFQPKIDVSDDTEEEILHIFHEKYLELGPVSVHEYSSVALMVVTIVGLLSRMSEAPSGWITDKVEPPAHARTVQIEDSTVLIIAVAFGFFFPHNFKRIFKGPQNPNEKPKLKTVLAWNPVQESFPWGILIIVGSSVSLGEGYLSSGLDQAELGRFTWYNKQFHKEITLLITILYTIVVSNTVGSTCAAIVGARIFARIDSSCYFSVPTVTASSFAFLFPVGTSTMAVASLKMDGINGWYCIKKGFLPSIVCPFIVYLFGLYYSRIIPCAAV